MSQAIRALIIAFLIVLRMAPSVSAQSVRLDGMKDNFKKDNLIRLSGGISANAVFDAGAGESLRDPFTWFINGNLNARLFNLIDLPISMFLTNSGQGLNYPTPPTRLSVHPSYKWATAHIGDISMAFSPYTLNGHQFSGVGVDLAPPGHWKASAMYGRLQRASDYDSANLSTKAAFQRMGYGGKVGYDADNWRLAYTFFAAKDDPGSIDYVPDSLDIRPMQNVVMSWEGGYKIMKGLELNAEYATSAMNTDNRDTLDVSTEGTQLLRPLIRESGTTAYFHAIRGSLNYGFKQTIIGLGYERVDPGYRTLGAYYFNEDLENYTLNLSQAAMKGRLNLSGSFGFQRDDLNGAKSGSNKRIIGSLNAGYSASERLNLSANYSNFQTYMHIKSQFEQINQVGPYQNYDTLRFTQISQNAGANIFYLLKKTETSGQSVNLSLTFLDATDKQGETVRTGGKSQFYNGSIAYSLQFIPKAVTVNAGINVSYNTIGAADFVTLGPLAAMNVQLFDRKVATSLAMSYNVSSGNGMQKSDVFNTRFSASYLFFKKHNLNLGIMNQMRNSSQGSRHDLIATLAYGFSF